MKILNFGSLNIDHVYSVDHFVRPGETLASRSYRRYAGGKGNNQSIALARAGAQVWHAGKVGRDGEWLIDNLRRAGVNTAHIKFADVPTGHAIIQVNAEGENCIVLYGGANQTVSQRDAKAVLSRFDVGDVLLLQNEISAVPDILRIATDHGMTIVFNPAPMDASVLSYPLDRVAVFIINETEGSQFTGQGEPDRILDGMLERYPRSATILTLGARGAVYAHASERVAVPAENVKAVDTTAAGDTFTGFFVTEFARGSEVELSLRMACKAAAICVTRRGAADSIPRREELKL